MINETEKLTVIKAAREWARAERRLREIAWYPNAKEDEKQHASRESDRTEAWLLDAVRQLEYAEGQEKILFFMGERVEVGQPISEVLYEYLKAQAPVDMKRWPR